MSDYTGLLLSAMEFPLDEDHHADVAKKMVISDIENMGDEDFLTQKSSDICASFMKVCVDSSYEQLNEIKSIMEAETELDDMGVGDDQTRVDLWAVTRAVHNNYSMGMSVLSHYMQIFEHLKSKYYE
jgi:hypothetical protein